MRNRVRVSSVRCSCTARRDPNKLPRRSECIQRRNPRTRDPCSLAGRNTAPRREPESVQCFVPRQCPLTLQRVYDATNGVNEQISLTTHQIQQLTRPRMSALRSWPWPRWNPSRPGPSTDVHDRLGARLRVASTVPLSVESGKRRFLPLKLNSSLPSGQSLWPSLKRRTPMQLPSAQVQ